MYTQGCRKALSDHTQASQSIADALCCILLLEDKTPRQVFQDFLVARMVSEGSKWVFQLEYGQNCFKLTLSHKCETSHRACPVSLTPRLCYIDPE